MERIFGRESELSAIERFLASARAGHGCTLFVAGEPGMGKTTLIDQAIADAQRNGFKSRVGRSSRDSGEPFGPFAHALRGRFEAISPHAARESRFNSLAILTSGRKLLASKTTEGGVPAESLASVVSSVQEFMGDAIGSNGSASSLGKLTYGGLVVLAERLGGLVAVGSIEGEEHPAMRQALFEALRRLESYGPALTKDWAERLLERLTERRFAAQVELAGARLESERARICDRILAAISEESEEAPLLLVIEDLHWADASTMQAVSHVALGIGDTRTLLLVTLRPGESDEASARIKRLAEMGLATELALTSLDAESISSILTLHFPGIAFDQSLPPWLQGRCSGNPFFIKEVVRQMLEDGTLVMDGGVRRLDGGASAVPSSVLDVVQKRLSSLSAEALAMAEFASCAGPALSTNLAMSNGAISDPRDALEQLEAAGIVAKGETPYFSHALYRDAIYSSMNSRWRATHHRAIGAHLESRRRVDTEPVFELARHCYLGRDWVRVMRYCPRAAEDSERLFAVEQAIMFHRATLEALEMSAEKAKLSEQYYGTATRLASLLMLGGRWDEAERTMLGSAQECGGLGLRGLQARNLTMLGNLLQDRARYDEAWLNLEKAQEIFASLGDRRGQGAVSHSMGIVTARRGDFEGAKSLYRKAIAIGEETGDERLVSKAVNSLGVEMSITGDDASAMECFKRRLEIDERIGDMHGIGVAVGNIGELLRIAGRYDEAMAAFRRKLEIGQKLGDKYTESIALGNMGIVHDTLGQYERAMDCYSRKLRLSEELGDRRSAAVAVSNMGICMYSQGKLCEAEGHYNKAWAMASEIGDKQVLSGCALERIRVRWVRGDIAGALESFDQAIHLCRDSKQKARLCRGLMDHAQILLDTGDVEKARGVVGEACSMASAIQSEIQIAEGEMLKGRVLTFDDAIRAEEAMRELVLRTPNKLVAAEAAYRIYRLTGAERDRVDALERYKGLLDKCYFILHDIRMKELAGEITGPVSLPPPS